MIAFSTGKAMRVPHEATEPTRTQTLLRDQSLSPLFQAMREATETAIFNSLFKAGTATGYCGRTIEEIPIGRVFEIGKSFGPITPES